MTLTINIPDDVAPQVVDGICAATNYSAGSGKSNGARRVKFIPEITLGNVLQLVSLGAAVVGLWVNMDKRISAVELRENYGAEERRDMKRSLQTLTETQAVLVRTVDRMSILFEQHGKEGK